VIGVVEDFHFSSMKEGIMALGIFPGRSDGSVIFRFSTSNAQHVIESLEKVWKQMAPGPTFSIFFFE